MKDGLDGKRMQGKSKAAMRTRSFRAQKRLHFMGLADYPFMPFMASLIQT